MRIFLKLTSLIVVTALITLAGILFVTWTDNSATLKAQAVSRLMELAAHTMDKMDRYLSERKGDLVVIATDPVISSRDSTMEEVTERLRSFKDIYGRYNSLSFFSLDGVRLADTEGLGVGQRQSAFKGWGGVREGHPSAAEEVGFSETLKEPVVFFASLVRDKAGDAIGFVVTRVPISGLYEILGDVSSSPFGGLGSYNHVDLVNRNGILLYSSYDPKGILKEDFSQWEAVRRVRAGERQGVVERHRHGKEENLAVFCSEAGYLNFEGNGWILIIHTPTKAILDPVLRLRARWLAVIIPVVILAVGLSFFFSYRLSLPLDELKKVAGEFGKGNLDARIGFFSDDEIGALARAFNQMAEDLKKTTISVTVLKEEMRLRAETEKKLKESEENYRALYDSSADAIMVLEPPDLRFTSGNTAAVRMFGARDLGEFLSVRPWEVSPERQPDGKLSAEKARSMIEKAMNEGKNFFEWTHKRLTGEEFPATVLLSSVIMGGKSVVQATVRDITELKKAENVLKESKKKMEDQAGELAKSLEEASRNKEILVSMLEDNNWAREELEKAMKNLKETRKMVMEMEKLEAVGRMASGLAHEVRNPLGVILQGLNYIESDAPKDEAKLRDVISMMKNNLSKADGIISSLLDFSRASSFQLRPEDITGIIEASLVFITHDVKYEKIKVVKNIPPVLPRILADKGKMEQVFVNLFSNAVHAMPGGGTLTISAYETRLETSKGKISERYGDFFPSGERVMAVEVEDTGEGIREENIVKVFDPFFTTKEQGKGTGLGLSVVKSIMDMHGAAIEIESRYGAGTKITMYLGLAQEKKTGGVG